MSDPKLPPNSSGNPRLVQGWTRGRVIFLVLSAVCIVTLLVAVREVLLPFILGVIIAYVLTPLVALCERARIPRSVSIVLVYTVTAGLLYASVAAMAPRLYRETVNLARDVPTMTRDLAANWGPRVDDWVQGYLDLVGHSKNGKHEGPMEESAELDPAFVIRQMPDGSYAVELGGSVDLIQTDPGHWRIVNPYEKPPDRFQVRELIDQGLERFVNYIKINALQLLKIGQSFVSRVARGSLLVVMTFMVAGYLMHTREDVLGFIRSLPPPSVRPSFERLLWRIDRGVAGVIRGQLMICLVNGVLSAIGFWIFGLKYWPILSIVAGVMSLIPIFGSILSTIPAVLIGLTQDVWIAFWVLVWIIGIHQLEANLLNPKIIGVTAKIHPVLVVLSLIIGEHFWGLWGALLAVPTLSLTLSIFNHFRFEVMPDVPPDSLSPPDGTPETPPIKAEESSEVK